MKFLLNLFPAYHALKAEAQRLLDELQESRSREYILQDRLDSAIETQKKSWELLQESLAGERKAYQSAINVEWQKLGRGAPYPEAPHLSPDAVPHSQDAPTVPRRRIGSEAVADGTRAFIREVSERMKGPQ